MNFSKHPKTKFILLNVLAAIVILFIIGLIVMSRLAGYTMHGKSISVPVFYDLTQEEAAKIAAKNNLRIMVIDSLYEENIIPGNILEQYPLAGAKVKNNRMIQLTINARNPEQIIFPKLNNTPYRQTLQTLITKGFKIGKIEYAPSDFKNLVLNLKYKNQNINPGDLIRKGATIDIVLGNGNEENYVSTPRLIGMTVNDALQSLKSNYLNIKQIIPDASITDKTDNLSAIVYKQEPSVETQENIPAGSYVTLYITLNKQRIKDLDSLMITE